MQQQQHLQTLLQRRKVGVNDSLSMKREDGCNSGGSNNKVRSPAGQVAQQLA
jgi:hypothetical protein